MGFKELDDVFDSSLKLPIGGKIYTVHAVDAKTGLWLKSITEIAARRMNTAAGGGPKELSEQEAASLELDDDEEFDLFQKLLGPTLEELKADGVDWERIKLVGKTATIYAMHDKDTAEQFWNNGGTFPKVRKKPTDRKAPAKSARQGSTATTSHGRSKT